MYRLVYPIDHADPRLDPAMLLDLARDYNVDPLPGMSGGSRMVPVPHARYSRAHDLVAAVPGDWALVQFVLLYPSQQIVAHSDPKIPNTRYHIPIQMNAGCWVYSFGVWQQLTPGCVYTMDPAEPHGAVNWGGETRIHLVIDSA